LASAFHWDPSNFSESKGLSVTSYFYSPLLKPPEKDKVNSSLGYAIQAHLAVVRIDPITYDVKIIKYVISHDSGRILHKELLDGQIYGGLMHGIALALYEELKYDNIGNLLSTLFDSYETPTLSEAIGIDVEILHFETPMPYLPSGALGSGEGPIMGAPAAIANAVSNALRVRVNEVPIRPEKVMRWLSH
jgi:2-furoyl-CoA dehydrogenase large subunit